MARTKSYNQPYRNYKQHYTVTNDVPTSAMKIESHPLLQQIINFCYNEPFIHYEKLQLPNVPQEPLLIHNATVDTQDGTITGILPNCFTYSSVFERTDCVITMKQDTVTLVPSSISSSVQSFCHVMETDHYKTLITFLGSEASAKKFIDTSIVISSSGLVITANCEKLERTILIDTEEKTISIDSIKAIYCYFEVRDELYLNSKLSMLSVDSIPIQIYREGGLRTRLCMNIQPEQSIVTSLERISHTSLSSESLDILRKIFPNTFSIAGLICKTPYNIFNRRYDMRSIAGSNKRVKDEIKVTFNFDELMLDTIYLNQDFSIHGIQFQNISYLIGQFRIDDFKCINVELHFIDHPNVISSRSIKMHSLHEINQFMRRYFTYDMNTIGVDSFLTNHIDINLDLSFDFNIDKGSVENMSVNLVSNLPYEFHVPGLNTLVLDLQLFDLSCGKSWTLDYNVTPVLDDVFSLPKIYSNTDKQGSFSGHTNLLFDIGTSLGEYLDHFELYTHELPLDLYENDYTPKSTSANVSLTKITFKGEITSANKNTRTVELTISWNSVNHYERDSAYLYIIEDDDLRMISWNDNDTLTRKNIWRQVSLIKFSDVDILTN
jgi:hypothetical protein